MNLHQDALFVADESERKDRELAQLRWLLRELREISRNANARKDTTAMQLRMLLAGVKNL